MPAPFFLYVDGKGRPKKPHSDMESARAEALRLFMVATRNRILIYETVDALNPPSDLPPLPPQPERSSPTAPIKSAPVIEVKKRRSVVAK